jgi:hypothetical protein
MKTLIRSIAILGIGTVGAFTLTAPASAMSLPDAPIQPRSDVIRIHDHGHHHHHQRRGFDGYYDNYDNSGVLFKSFVTGTLFRHDGQQGYYADRRADCAAHRSKSGTVKPAC